MYYACIVHVIIISISIFTRLFFCSGFFNFSFSKVRHSIKPQTRIYNFYSFCSPNTRFIPSTIVLLRQTQNKKSIPFSIIATNHSKIYFMNMSRFFLIIFQFILPLQIKAAGICRADQATTCSGSNSFFQCLDGTQTCPSSVPASHRAITLPVSSWVGLKQCTNIPTGGCDMQKPLIATADLNDDGLLDAVISVQLGGNHNSGPRTQYEVLLLINDVKYITHYHGT